MPCFALFFPVELAIGLTAVVHLFNNLFKLVLVGKFAEREVVVKFGIGAIVSAFIGATLLGVLSNIKPIYEYEVFNRTASITPVKLLIAILLIVFVWLESLPSLEGVKIERKYLWLGGVLSGFFGGLSGNQGALRSMFLLKCNLTKESFIATGVVIACVIDIARLIVYRERFTVALSEKNTVVILSACIAAFLGAFVGARLLPKITMHMVQRFIAVMLIAISFLMASGIL